MGDRSFLRRMDVAAGVMNPALVLVALGLALADAAVLGARVHAAVERPTPRARSCRYAPDRIHASAAGMPQPGQMRDFDGRD